MTARRLCVISLLRGDRDQTLRHYRTSLNEFRTLGAPKDVLPALSDTGMLCTDLERCDDAICAFDEAVEIADALRLARIHEQIGQAMEDRAPSNAAEIASHYDHAGIPEKTYRHAMAAGDAALAIYAHGDARKFFEVAERVPADPVDRARALHRLAEVAETESRHVLSEELCDRALAGLDVLPDDYATLGLRRMRHRARALQGQPAQTTITACRELLVPARALGDHAEESQLLNMISQYQGRLGEWREAEDAACEALKAAERTDNARLLAESLTRLGTSVRDRRSTDAADFHNRALSLFCSAA